MPRERLPLKRKVRNKDTAIDISNIFRNTDVQDEAIINENAINRKIMKLKVKVIGDYPHLMMVLIGEPYPEGPAPYISYFEDGIHYRILFSEEIIGNTGLIPSNWREKVTEADALDCSNSYPTKDRDIAYESFLVGANSRKDYTYPKYIIVESIEEQNGDYKWVTPRTIPSKDKDGFYECIIKEIIW